METNARSKQLSAFFMLTLLLFAFTFSGIIAFIHSKGHDHKTEHCSPEKESDACHIAVFHLDLESDCAHETHVFDSDENCFFCHLFLPDITPVYLNSDRSINDHFFTEIKQSFYQIDFEECPDLYHLRAPPVCT